MLGENWIGLALALEIWIGHWDPHFTLRSKIHVMDSTILKVLLILVSNRNCAWKIFGLIWPVLEITSLKTFKTKFWLFIKLCYKVSKKSFNVLIWMWKFIEIPLKQYEIPQSSPYYLIWFLFINSFFALRWALLFNFCADLNSNTALNIL